MNYIPTPVMSYHFKARFQSLTAVLSGIDLNVLSVQLCSISGVELLNPGVVKFQIRTDADNLVIKALTAIIETQTVHAITNGVDIEISLVNGGGNDIFTVQLIEPEIVSIRLANLDYSLNESTLFEVDIKYNGTNYVTA
jgi:hypothetical protein